VARSTTTVSEGKRDEEVRGVRVLPRSRGHPDLGCLRVRQFLLTHRSSSTAGIVQQKVIVPRVLSKNPHLTQVNKKYMTLENQVTSLELSQKLKELGFKQDSLFYWGKLLHKDEYKIFGLGAEIDEVTRYSAYTVAELGEMLPNYINIPYKNGKTKSPNHFLVLKKYPVDKHNWGIRYYRTSRSINIEKRADTEADARAKMLIYLKENNLLT